jgi:hypothetical protein
VASLGSLGATTWEGKGQPAPEMLVIACNGLEGVLKTTPPLRVWRQGATKADGTVAVCCGGVSQFETIAGCASSKKWHKSLKVHVGDALVPVSQIPGLVDAGPGPPSSWGVQPAPLHAGACKQLLARTHACRVQRLPSCGDWPMPPACFHEVCVRSCYMAPRAPVFICMCVVFCLVQLLAAPGSPAAHFREQAAGH